VTPEQARAKHPANKKKRKKPKRKAWEDKPTKPQLVKDMHIQQVLTKREIRRRINDTWGTWGV
jgi:hypothetical protein